MSTSADSSAQEALQRRLGLDLRDLEARVAALRDLDACTSRRDVEGRGQPDLVSFAQVIVDIARSAGAVSRSANAVINEFVERGLIKLK